MLCCSQKKSTDKTEVVLGFYRADLLYDISNAAYIEGSILEGDDAHRRHTVQDVAQEGNVDRITRVLELGVAQCREALYPYSQRQITCAALDDVLHDPEMYGIAMRVPQSFSQTTLNLLEFLIHEYLVCTGVAEWMSITNPAKAALWKNKAAAAERDIGTAVHSRMKVLTRRPQPF